VLLIPLCYIYDIDPPSREYPCPNRKCEAQVKDIWTHCADCGKHLPACIVSGRSLLGVEETWTCRVCKHRASERDISVFTCCPLCHTPLVCHST
jgi:WD repeat-containing protein 35